MMRHLLSTVCAVIVLDQVTKYLASQANLVTLNTGISFGMGDGRNQALLAIVITVLMVLIWFWAKKLWQKYPVIAGFVFGGGTSNVIDRLLFSGVRDWLPVPGTNLSNNFADWSISLSLAAILLLELKRTHEPEKEKDSNGT